MSRDQGNSGAITSYVGHVPLPDGDVVHTPRPKPKGFDWPKRDPAPPRPVAPLPVTPRRTAPLPVTPRRPVEPDFVPVPMPRPRVHDVRPVVRDLLETGANHPKARVRMAAVRAQKALRQLQDLLDGNIVEARPIGGAQVSARRLLDLHVTPHGVRAWAAENNVPCRPTGYVQASVIDAYESAHNTNQETA